MKTLILVSPLFLGIIFPPNKMRVDKYREGLDLIAIKTNVSDELAPKQYEYAETCFYGLNQTKQQKKELNKTGCYSPLY